MAFAMCTQCDCCWTWHKAGRGARLADLRCTDCGGELRRADSGDHPYMRGPTFPLGTPRDDRIRELRRYIAACAPGRMGNHFAAQAQAELDRLVSTTQGRCMMIETRCSDGVTVVRLRPMGSPSTLIEERQVRLIREELDRLLVDGPAQPVMIDWTGITFGSSAVLGVILRFGRSLFIRGRRLYMCGIADAIYDVLETTRITRQIRCSTEPDPGARVCFGLPYTSGEPGVDMDQARCMDCGRLVFCAPEGLALCDECAQRSAIDPEEQGHDPG